MVPPGFIAFANSAAFTMVSKFSDMFPFIAPRDVRPSLTLCALCASLGSDCNFLLEVHGPAAFCYEAEAAFSLLADETRFSSCLDFSFPKYWHFDSEEIVQAVLGFRTSWAEICLKQLSLFLWCHHCRIHHRLLHHIARYSA